VKRIAIYGAGGLGREIRGMIEMEPDKFSFAGFIDDYIEPPVKVKGDHFDDILIAIADSNIRLKLVDNWLNKWVPFNKLINSDIKLHSTVSIGKGSIICPGTKMTVDIRIGKFVIVNLNSTIGHDSVIGDFVSIMPSVNISGNVKIGMRSFIGSGATVLQGITIGDNAIIGAGSLVNKDVPPNCVVMGVPARIVKLHHE
jgi:sugar O-acyltransferase (sialic acid O-acetyltransferase NeuD family)